MAFTSPIGVSVGMLIKINYGPLKGGVVQQVEQRFDNATRCYVTDIRVVSYEIIGEQPTRKADIVMDAARALETLDRAITFED